MVAFSSKVPNHRGLALTGVLEGDLDKEYSRSSVRARA